MERGSAQPKAYENYIDGEWRKAASGEVFDTINPANKNHVSTVQESGIEDSKYAIEAARTAFENSWWRDEPQRRAKVLHKLAEIIRENTGNLARVLTQENGQPLQSSTSEVMWTADFYEHYAGLTDSIYGRSTSLSSNSYSMINREPIGVVGIIVPWNAPIILLARSLAPCLAAGNSTIIKPASYTAGVSSEFVNLIHLTSAFPKGILNHITGPGGKVGAEIARNQDVDMVSFTGDTSTGKEIMRLASNNVKKQSLELGGKSPNIIFDDADIDKAAGGAVSGACLSLAGQVCYAGTRILVQETIHQIFLSKIKNILPTMKIGNGLNEDVEIGPVISERQMNNVLDYIESGKSDAKLFMGGHRLIEGEASNGFFIEPTVFDEVPPDSKIAQEEIFGPVLSVIPFRTEAEAIEIANNSIFGLAAAVNTKNIDRAFRVAKRIKAGTVWINTYGMLHPSAEVGGYKQSGIGRLQGLEAIHEFMQYKHVYLDISQAP